MSKNAIQSGNFRWPVQGIRYFGILFPFNLSDIMKVNIEPLLENVKLDIESWSPLHLSLWAKANVLKMSVAPKFNSILQSLPVDVTVNLFRRFDKLNLFLWNGKQARIHLKKLQQKCYQGGLGIPNLLLYHYAFSLLHLAQWYLPLNGLHRGSLQKLLIALISHWLHILLPHFQPLRRTILFSHVLGESGEKLQKNNNLTPS